MAGSAAATTGSIDALIAAQSVTEPSLWLHVLGTIAVAGLLWWWREHRLGRQRRVLRGIMRASGDLLDAPSPREMYPSGSTRVGVIGWGSASNSSCQR